MKTKSKKAVIDPLYGAPSVRRDTPGHYHKAPTQMTPLEQFPVTPAMTGGHGMRGLTAPTEGVSTTVDRMHLSAEGDEEEGTEIEKDAYGNTVSDLTNSSSGSYVGANDWAKRMPDLIDPNRDTIPVLGRLGDHLGKGHEGTLVLADSPRLRHVTKGLDDVLELERRAVRSDDDWSFGDVNDLLSREGAVIHEDVLHDLIGSDSQHAVGILTITASDVNVLAPEDVEWTSESRDKVIDILEQAVAEDATGTALTNYRAMEVALHNLTMDLERGVFPTDPGGRGAPASEGISAVEEVESALRDAAGRGPDAYADYFSDLLFGDAPEGAEEEVAAWAQGREDELTVQAPGLLTQYRGLYPLPAGEDEGHVYDAEQPHVPIRRAESDEQIWLPVGSLVTVADPQEDQVEYTGAISSLDERGGVHVTFFDRPGQDAGEGVFLPDQLVQAVSDEPEHGTVYRPVTFDGLVNWQEDIAEGQSDMPLPETEDIGELSTLVPQGVEETDIGELSTLVREQWMADPQPVESPLEVLETPELVEDDEDDIDKESALSFEINDRGPPFGPHNLSVNPRTDQSMGMSSREAAWTPFDD